MKYRGLSDVEVKISVKRMEITLYQIRNLLHFGMNSKRPLEIL